MIRPSLPNGLREGVVVAIARRLDAAVPATADALAEGGIRAFEDGRLIHRPIG